MSDIIIKEYKHKHLSELKSIFSDNLNYIPLNINLEHTLLLLENSKVIGVGSTWNNSYHPYRQYVSVYIVPFKRNKKLGKLLYETLENKYKLRNIQTAFNSDNLHSCNFVISCGFKLVRRCFEYKISKKMLKPYTNTHMTKIVSIEKLNDCQIDYLIETQLEDYRYNHKKINPLDKNLSLQNWKDNILDSINKKYSYVYMKNNRIKSYLLCYGYNESTIEIGYTGNRCNNLEEYKNFLNLSIYKLFDKYNLLTFEIDDCDKNANILGELFIYKPNYSWNTYIKDL